MSDNQISKAKENLIWSLYGIGVGLIAVSIPFFDALTGIGVIIAFIAAVTIAVSFSKKPAAIPLWSPEYALALMIVMAGISIAAASDKMLAGMRFLELLTGAAIFVLVKAYARRNPDTLKSFTLPALFPFALVVLFSVAQVITIDYIALIPADMKGGLAEVKGRISSIFDSPNILAPYLLLALPFLFSVITISGSGRKEKGMLFVLWFLGLCCLVCTFSRNGWLAVIISTALMALLSLSGRIKRILIASVLIVLFIFAAAWMLKGDTVRSYFYRNGPDMSRMVTYRTALTMLHDRPVLGVGIGNFRTAFPLYFSRGDITFFDGSAAWSAHNTLLNFTVETGILGGAAFVWFITAVLLRLVRGRKRGPPEGTLIQGCLWSIIALLLFGIFDCTISHHKCGFAFFFIAGCAMGLLEADDDKSAAAQRDKDAGYLKAVPGQAELSDAEAVGRILQNKPGSINDGVSGETADETGNEIGERGITEQ
ncbi:MAG: O-antigen ligase family protein [Candidatus Xenobiia bacterium LiM19]